MPTSNLKHQGAERLQFAPRGKVLLVDEDVKDLDSYRAILQEQGYQVRIFASHAEALSNLDCESFDIVVVSIDPATATPILSGPYTVPRNQSELAGQSSQRPSGKSK